MLIYLIIASVCYLGAWSKAPKKAYQLSFFALWFFMAFRGLDLSSKVDGFYYHDFFENDVTTLAQFDFDILSYTRTVQAKTGFGWGSRPSFFNAPSSGVRSGKASLSK